MKKKNLIFVGLLTTMVAGAFSFAMNKAQSNVKEAKADYGGIYYLVGQFDNTYSTYKNLEDWNNNQDNYPVKCWNAEPVVFHFIDSTNGEADKFKFTRLGLWNGDNEYNFSNLDGSAKECFEGDGTDIICNTTGDYDVYLSGNKLYIDKHESVTFYYTGSDGTKCYGGKAWEPTGQSGSDITVGGTPRTFSFTKEEEFKFVLPRTWDGQLSWPNLGNEETADIDSETNVETNYYRSFKKRPDGNIHCRVTGNYNVSINHNGHGNYKITIVRTTSELKTCYVLDLNGNQFRGDNMQANVHTFNNTLAIQSKWPGPNMPLVDGTFNIYKAEYLPEMEKLIFNNNVGTETIHHTLSGKENKCLILSYSKNGNNNWDSNTWVSLDTAKYIDKYMKFNVNHEDNGSSTEECASNYLAAKNAYNAASFADYRTELCTSAIVVERLQNWATANGEKFEDGSFVVPNAQLLGIHNKTTNESSMTVAVIISAVSVTAIGLMFLLKKRKIK